MGYDAEIINREGNVQEISSMSFNWNGFGLHNVLSLKRLNGHTTETVLGALSSWLMNNPYYYSYYYTYTEQRNIAQIMKDKGMTNDVSVLIEKFDVPNPIDDIINYFGKPTKLYENLDEEDLKLYREYKHIHAINCIRDIALANPDCYWQVDYEHEETWNGNEPMTFQEFLNGEN